MSRVYKIDEVTVGAYMQSNRLAESSIVGEMSDQFLVKRGNKISPLKKAEVEKWAINHGFVEGLGYDAMSDQDKGTAETNRQRNTMRVKEEASRLAANKDENLKAYHDQLPETRMRRAKDKDQLENIKRADGPIKGIDYKGDKTYK